MADAITVQHLVVRRGRRTILHDFSVAMPKGKVTAIIGPNLPQGRDLHDSRSQRLYPPGSARGP